MKFWNIAVGLSELNLPRSVDSFKSGRSIITFRGLRLLNSRIKVSAAGNNKKEARNGAKIKLLHLLFKGDYLDPHIARQYRYAFEPEYT